MVLISDTLPLSLKGIAIFLDKDWKKVKKGKAWNIWQSQSSPAKAELLLKQIIFSWIQWRTMSPVTHKYMATSFFLQSLTAAMLHTS